MRELRSMGRRVFSVLFVLLLVALASHPAEAVESVLDRTIDVDIPAQQLTTALFELSKQAAIQVLTSPEVVGAATSEGAHGRMTVREALTQLLRGTKLGFHQAGNNTIGVDPAQAASGPPVTTQSSVGPQATPATPGGHSETGTPAEEVPLLNQVTVVGSRLGQSANNSAQPVKFISQQEIQRSGAENIAQVLNELPEVSSQSSGIGTSQGLGSATTVQLRGLPTGTTLVLLNGRRMETTGAQSGSAGAFLDLSTIPLAAVDHIEILPTGSSAIYGGDALAGVVNIVLKRDFNGVEVGARYGHASGYDEEQYQLAWGHRWSRGNLSIVGSYGTNGSLVGAERAITATDDKTRYGGADGRSTFTDPGNIFSTNGRNLPGLNSTFAAVPTGSTGVGMTPADFAAGAGKSNLQSLNIPYTSLYAPQNRYGLFAYGTYDLTSSVRLFTEVLYSHSAVNVRGVPLQFSASVPTSNPFNPFGVPVSVRSVLTDANNNPIPDETTYREETFRPLVGVQGSLGAWDWELAGWVSRDWDESGNTTVNTAALSAGLAATDPSQSLNVFRDGPAGSPALVNSLLTTTQLSYQGGIQAASGFIRGPLAMLPSGPIEALLGGEYERDTLSYPAKSVLVRPIDDARTARSIFSELRVPILGNHGENGGADVLALPLAARYDDYSDFGGHVSLGGGLEFRPFQSLLLRASYSSAFKPPPMASLYSALGSSATSTVADPQLNGLSVPVKVLLGGNPDLLPETGHSTNFGVVYSPEFVRALSLSATSWAMRINNGFTTPNLQFIASNSSLYPGRITRDPTTGQIALVNDTVINYGYIDEAGLDFGIDWKKTTSFGEFTPSLSASEVYRYVVQAAPNAAPTDNVGKASSTGYAPRWKGFFSLAWKYQVFSASVDGRYTGRYQDYAPLTNGVTKTLGNLWYFDTSARYEIGQQWAPDNRYAKGAFVAAGVRNLFNRQPVFSNFAVSYSYDPSQYDILGRFVYVQVGVKL